MDLNKKGFLHKDEAFCSPYKDDMRKIFPLQWLIRVLRRGPKRNMCEIDYQKLLNLYPDLNDVNQNIYTKFVNSESSNKKNGKVELNNAKFIKSCLIQKR